MNQSVWKWAAELFAASFLETCPEALLSDVWVGRLGFYVEYSLPFPLTDELLKRIEERMREKIVAKVDVGVFTMSTKNLIEFYKDRKQFKLARKIDRSLPEIDVVRIGDYIGIADGFAGVQEMRALHFERQEGCIHGLAFPSKEDLKAFRKKERVSTEDVYQIEGKELYWLPVGLAFRKRLEARIETFLEGQGFQEVEFFGDIEWYGERKVFTTLEEEEFSRFECGLLDYPVQKVYFVANSTLQMFKDFGTIVPLVFEEDDGLVLSDDWVAISQEGGGVKIWIDRIAAMLVEKRDFLV